MLHISKFVSSHYGTIRERIVFGLVKIMGSFLDDLQQIATNTNSGFLLSENLDGVFKGRLPQELDYDVVSEIVRKHDKLLVVSDQGVEFHPIAGSIAPITIPADLTATVLTAKNMKKHQSGGVCMLTFEKPYTTSTYLDAVRNRDDVLKMCLGDGVVHVYQILQSEHKGGLAHCKRRGMRFEPKQRRVTWNLQSAAMRAGKSARNARQKRFLGLW